MAWCFHCDRAYAMCPECGINDCGCGCGLLESPCRAQGWWDGQNGEDWELALAMYWRPSRDELVTYIKALEKECAKHGGTPPLAYTPLKEVLEYASWLGLNVGFHLEGEEWRIWLIEEPTGEGREHVRTREKAEKSLAREREWANRK